ncbi:MAG: hypothetical protein KDA65_08845, partial [Planctomycetaceae bacterium]|nr:hypothetical protein [Planctomycetaceae bacterium]
MKTSWKCGNEAGPMNGQLFLTSVSNRRGATLVVVLALLGLMMVIGFFAYKIAGQQQANSEYFANTPRAKARNVADFDRDALMNWALEQIIKGAPDSTKNSALQTGIHGLVPNMFGPDLYPYSGTGYHVFYDSGLAKMDNNLDGTFDGSPLLNYSRSANTGSVGALPTGFGNPDAGYTSPDLNSSFLAYRGYGVDEFGKPVLVVMPSYHRPQYLRESSGLFHR